jgi:hypothetical protein
MKLPIHLLMFLPTIKCRPTPTTLKSILDRLAHATWHDLSNTTLRLRTRRNRIRIRHLRHKKLNILSHLRIAVRLPACCIADDVDEGIGADVQPGHWCYDDLGFRGGADAADGVGGFEGGAVVLAD